MRIKRYIPNISLMVLIIFIGLIFIVPTSSANAGTIAEYAGFPSPMDLLNSFLAYFVNIILATAGFLLSMAASILDVSIKLTLHIKDFVDATPAIYTVWQTLRDISGLFFIFVLLYAAIRMITGLGKGSSYGDTIKNIIIAGIMINFSFFIVSVGIDASNVVSQAIYNAMIPNHANVSITKNTTLSNLAERDSTKPDISNIFMNSLKIQSLYNTQGNKIGVAVSDPFKIILIGIVGVIMMLTTAASFVLAAIAFIARLVILLFLLAFSSLWFAGTIIPGISKYVDQFKEQLIAQLIFMPVYLLLMYVALRILNESNIMGVANTSITSLPTGTNWAFPYIILGVNFTIVIIMLNLPLVAGLSLGGKATSILGKNIGKWSAGNVWGNVGGWTKNRGSWAYNNTGGRAASKIAENEWLRDKASTSKIGALALRSVSGAATDYNKKLNAQVEARTKFSESLGYNKKNAHALESEIRRLKRQQSSLRANGDKDGAKALDGAIKNNEELLMKEKNARKDQYSTRINTGSYDTLWTKTARKNKVAAAKIQSEIIKTKLERENKALEKIRNDIKEKRDALDRIEADVVKANGYWNGKQTEQKTKLNKDIQELSGKETPALESVNDLEAQMSANQDILNT